MSGRMGLAIEHTFRSYPGLLENNQNLLFMLKCRQFVEMVNGSDFEVSGEHSLNFKFFEMNANLEIKNKYNENQIFKQC